MKIAMGSDHAGLAHKVAIKQHLEGKGDEVVDFGTYTDERCDYPVFVRPAAEAVARGECERGIVLGGSGNGEAMVANRIRGVRCALAWNEESAIMARRHNDANCLSLGQRMVSRELALKLVDLFLSTPYDGGRHQRRLEMMDAF